MWDVSGKFPANLGWLVGFLHMEIMANCIEFHPQVVSLKLGLVLEGSGTVNLKGNSSVGSVLESSCHQLSNAH